MNPANQTAQDGAPNCWQCRHFSVSWDPKFPYLCRLMGFKSRVTPCIEVMRADGKRCQGFAAKPTTSNASPNSSTLHRRTV
ncbi:MAG: hypothetical protein ACK5AJ_11015 [bacterium]